MAQGWVLLAAGLACAVPFLNPLHVLPIQTFYEEWLAFALGLVAVLVARAAGPGFASIPRVAVWLGAFGLVLVVQWALELTAYRETVELGLLYVLWAALLVWLGADLRARYGAARASRALAGALVGAALVNAAVALAQAYTGSSVFETLLPAPGGGRPFGLLGQANLLANLLVLGLAALVFLAASGGMRVFIAVALGAPLVLALALTGSRMAWLFAGWLLACGVPGLATGGTAARLALRGAVAIAIALVALQLLLEAVGGIGMPPTGRASAVGRLAEELAQAGQPVGGIGARLFLWRVALDVFAGSPLLGVGLGEFAWGYFNAHPPELIPALGAYQRQAHNLVLQLLAETGLAGAAPIALGLAGWLWRVIAAQARRWDAAIWLAAAVVGVALLHSMLEFPLWHAHFLGVAALFLGLGERSAVALKLTFVARWLPPLLAAAGIAVAAGTLWWYLQLSAWVYALPDAALADPAIRERQRAVVVRASGTLLRPQAELPLAASIAPSRARLAAQRALNERMMRFAPIGPIIYRQVTLLALAGDRDRAAPLLERALVLHPGVRGEYAASLEVLARAEPEALGWLLARVQTPR